MPAVQWTDRVWGEFHADNLTRAYRDVLLTLRTFRGTGGVCTPAHATLADRAGCSVRTVQRALRMAERLGLLSWCERRVRAGWRWLRTSNRYRLEHPEGDVRPGLRPAWPGRSTTGQSGRGGERSSKKEALQAMLREAATLPDLLARRRAAIETGLVGCGARTAVMGRMGQ